MNTGSAPRTHSQPEEGGGRQGFKRQRAFTAGGGVSPLLPVSSGARSADLISSAQLTPLQRRLNHRRLRSLAKSRSHKLHDVRRVGRIVFDNLQNGVVRKSPLQSEWDVSADCESPVRVELNGAPKDPLRNRRVPGWSHTLVMHVRCRKCSRCLRRRSNLWAHRARTMIAATPRTWMATFTMSPGNHFIMRARASHRLAQGGTDLNQLSGAEQFSELVREFGAEVTKYIKRIRKNTGANFRYLLVAEPHKSGQPHFHALFHEHREGELRHAKLTSEWKLGFTKFTLVSCAKAAWYVAKYLSKTIAARVRASLGYGMESTPCGPVRPDGSNVQPPSHTTSQLKPKENDRGSFNTTFNKTWDLAKALGASLSVVTSPGAKSRVAPATCQRPDAAASACERQRPSGHAARAASSDSGRPVCSSPHQAYEPPTPEPVV